MSCTDRFDWSVAWQEALFGLGLAIVVLLLIVAVVGAMFWLMDR